MAFTDEQVSKKCGWSRAALSRWRLPGGKHGLRGMETADNAAQSNRITFGGVGVHSRPLRGLSHSQFHLFWNRGLNLCGNSGRDVANQYKIYISI